jgi:glycosyltransferase involved in cell wall biosynthesis
VKILMVHNLYRQAGGEDVVQRAERALMLAHGHDVVEYLRDNHEIDATSVRGKLRLASSTLWAQDSARDLTALIERERPEVAHFTNTFPLVSPAAYYACRKAGVAVVQSLHNYRLLCPAATFFRDGKVCEECVHFGLQRSVRYACYHESRAQTAVLAGMLLGHRALGTYEGAVDRYIALTEFAREKLIEGGLPAERIRVKPNFLERDPGPRERSGNYAVFIGRMAREKGLRGVLSAWGELNGIPLRVIGDGPERSACEELARGIDAIELLGWQPRERVMEELRGARFLVFPSEWYEGFPMTILEAFACGVPVIGTRIGGVAEVVEDGKTGLLYSPGDLDALAERIKWAFEHPLEMERMGRAARTQYEKKYTAERNYELLMQIYEDAVQVRSAGRP